MNKNLLENTWFTLAIKNILYILVYKVFINLIIKIILKDKFKAKIVFLLNNSTFSFTYYIKIII